ncbi:MAG: hypothetical protein HS111_26295 [Kofleriaceae bacterium]|nr:hypothetical protein [Kofleriaceae bacterium]MCL4227291.1 hypothetical protein [Myxococcales bacterium]
MQAQTSNPAPVRAPCPTPPQPSLLGWLASLFGLTAPVYRGAGQPTTSGSVIFGQAPNYRPPRPRTQPVCPMGASEQQQQQSNASGEDGVATLTQPVLLEGPVTIVIGAHE